MENLMDWIGEKKGVIYSTNIECLLYPGIVLEAEGTVKHRIDMISSLMELTVHISSMPV